MAVSYTFYKNDGTSVSEQLPHMPATLFPDPAADFGWSVQGKTFKGWNTESDGSGTFYYTGDTIFTRTTFYAIWEAPVITYLTTDRDLTSVANAIRAKSGGSASLAFPAGFVSEIQAIPTGGNLPFGLVKEKTLIDTTFTADSDMTAGVSEAVLYTLDPILQANYNSTDAFYIFGYVAWKGSMNVADIETRQFLTSSSVISVVRTYGQSFYSAYTTSRMTTRYQSNWSYCANAQDGGLFLNIKSSNATNLVLKLQFSTISSGFPTAKAGNYAVKADLYKFNVLQLEGSLP